MVERKTDILDLHRSTHVEIVANRVDAFLDGVCHAIDELRAQGDDAAADRLEARIFKPRLAPSPEQPKRGEQD